MQDRPPTEPARFWRAAISDLPPAGRLRAAFASFARWFPDHASEHNTYVVARVPPAHEGPGAPPSPKLTWACTHFEHHGPEDLLRLADFLGVLGSLQRGGWPGATAVVELLDGVADRVVFTLYDPAPDVVAEVVAGGRDLDERHAYVDDPDVAGG